MLYTTLKSHRFVPLEASSGIAIGFMQFFLLRFSWHSLYIKSISFFIDAEFFFDTQSYRKLIRYCFMSLSILIEIYALNIEKCMV